MKKVKTSLDATGKAIYDKMLNDLQERGLYAPVDEELVRAYALEMQTYFRLFDEVAKEGETIATEYGGLKTNPKLKRMETALNTAKQLAIILGVTAGGRKSVGSAPKHHVKTTSLRLIKRAK